METLPFDNITELRRSKKELEDKLRIKIVINGKQVTFSGEAMDEYEASVVLDAISIGFPSHTALLLTDENYLFEKIGRNKHSNSGSSWQV